MRPLCSERASAGTGFGMDAMESIVPGSAMRETAYPGAALPYTDTENCGLPRIGIVSLGDSHGSILGCCLKSVNQEQAPSTVTTESRASRCPPRLSLSFIAYLERAVLAQQRSRLGGAIGAGD